MVDQFTSGNDPLAKKTYNLNGAGTSPAASILPSDPILEGLGISFQVRHHLASSILSAFSGLTSPASTSELSMSQDSVDPLLYRSEFAAGAGPTAGFAGLTGFVRVVMQDSFGREEVTVVERQLNIAALPDDAVQVENTDGEMIDVNLAKFPGVIPTVKQTCRVRFFPTWADEFSIRHFGGSSHCSVYSRNDSNGEVGISNSDVVREYRQVADQLERIVLARSIIGGNETHNLVFRFVSTIDAVSLVVDVNVDVITASCFPFLARGPEFPAWVPGT